MTTLKDRLSEYDWKLLREELMRADSAMLIVNRILAGQPRTSFGGMATTASTTCTTVARSIGRVRKHVETVERESNE